MNKSGAPPETWLLALEHVTHILNHIPNKSLGWKSPLQVMYGNKLNISSFLIFQFWEKAYCKLVNEEFPHDSTEKLIDLLELQRM